MKTFISLVLLTCVIGCSDKKDEKTFEVEGVIKNTPAAIIYLEENTPNGQLTIVDSAQLNNGSFKLHTATKEETRYQLRLGGQINPFISLINDVSKIKVKIDIKNGSQPVIEGSPASQAILDFDKYAFEQGSKIVSLGSMVDSLKFKNAPDSIIGVEYVKVVTAIEEFKGYALNFFDKSSSPILTLYTIGTYQKTLNNIGLPGLTKVELSQVLTGTADKFPAHKTLQTIKSSLASVKAPDFVQPDANGQPVSLSSFKGKYVLLDFWASWCKPCRIDNPNVVKAYHEFNDKNFTVFGVSLDLNKDAWLQAIQQDSLTWTHASDLKHWSNEAAALYGVQSIPANFLIDPQGNIIAQDLHGDDIVNTLRQVIK
jgi:peroxiredoxin/CxxC motif-containing protein